MHERSGHNGLICKRQTGRWRVLTMLVPGLLPALAAWRGGIIPCQR